MSKIINGQHVTIDELNVFFGDVTLFLLEHYDTAEYADAVIVLGTYLRVTMRDLRQKHPGKRIIIFQLESLISQNWSNNQTILTNIVGADEVWEYDPLNSEVLTAAGIRNKVVPFRYTKALDVGLDARECDIDLLFYGFLNARRTVILQPMQARLYGRRSFVFVFGVHGPELDDYIARSKIILNLHAFDGQAQEKVRMLRPVCNGKMVLSETSKADYYKDAICEFPSIDGLVVLLDHYLEHDRYKAFGAAAREKFKRLGDVR
jgi:hypothetical protein